MLYKQMQVHEDYEVTICVSSHLRHKMTYVCSIFIFLSRESDGGAIL